MLTVSSTTDSQAAVETAAGLTPGEATATAPAETEAPETAQQTPEPEEPETEEKPPEEPEEPETEEEEPAAPEAKRKPGRYERRIERLERELQYERKIRELESQIAGKGQSQPQEEPKPAGPTPRPVSDHYDTHEQFIEALTDWKIEQREIKRDREAQEQRAAQSQREQVETWQSRLDSFRDRQPDYDSAIAAVDDIKIHKTLEEAIITSELGPQLAYELAKDRKELERIAKLGPLAAVRELGKLEARITDRTAAAPAQRPISQAPEPIRPVGKGAATSTRPLDELPYQEYKKRREQDIRRQRSG